jgi:hypothetical protein
MKKAVCLVVISLIANSIFGSAHAEEDFNQIPTLGLLDNEQSRTLLMTGTITTASGTWRHVPVSMGWVKLNIVEFLDTLTLDQSVKIEKIEETIHEPFFTIGDCLFRLVKLATYTERYNIPKYQLVDMIFVSTDIVPSLAENPLIHLTRVKDIEEVIEALNSRSGPIIEKLQTIFPKKPQPQ